MFVEKARPERGVMVCGGVGVGYMAGVTDRRPRVPVPLSQKHETCSLRGRSVYTKRRRRLSSDVKRLITDLSGVE